VKLKPQNTNYSCGIIVFNSHLKNTEFGRNKKRMCHVMLHSFHPATRITDDLPNFVLGRSMFWLSLAARTLQT